MDKNGWCVRWKIVKKVVIMIILIKKGLNKDSFKLEFVIGGDNDGDKYSLVYKSIVVIKMIEGGENGSVVECFMMFFDDKDLIMVVKRDC